MFLIALIQSLSLAQSWAYWYSKGDNDSKCGAYDDSDFEATKQCCACGRGTYSGGGCDTVTVSGSSYNGKMHGTYTKLDFTCYEPPTALLIFFFNFTSVDFYANASKFSFPRL